jgi:hypothetical protein
MVPDTRYAGTRESMGVDFHVCPDALEVCDGVDNDGDGVVDNVAGGAETDGEIMD